MVDKKKWCYTINIIDIVNIIIVFIHFFTNHHHCLIVIVFYVLFYHRPTFHCLRYPHHRLHHGVILAASSAIPNIIKINVVLPS